MSGLSAFVASIQTLATAGKTVVFTTHYLREAEELARLAREMQERAARLKDRAPKDREADKRAPREDKPEIAKDRIRERAASVA